MVQYNEKEKCPCETDSQACCACVSMHCDECHKTFPGRSKFVQGRFCSNCGRPLKHDLERLYVPKNELEAIRADTVMKMHELIRVRCIEGGIYPAFVRKVVDQVRNELLKGE